MITQKDQCKSLQHKHGGNGYAVVQWLPDDYCRIVSWSFMPEMANGGGPSVPKLGNQAFLAWRKLLSPETTPKDPMNPEGEQVPYLLPPPIFRLLKERQEAIDSGAMRIVATRFVSA